MIKIAVVYHSGYGHTAVQAEHVAQGARQVKDTEVALIKAEEVTADPRKLNPYDAIIFGAPTYMGSLSAPFKAFMDATSGLWFAQEWKNKIAAGFTNSHSLSGDKFNSLVQLVTFAAQHGMIWVTLGLLNGSGNEQVKSGDVSAVNRVGSFIGAMAQSENGPPAVTPESGDKKTAELLGQRVAEITKQFVRGAV